MVNPGWVNKRKMLTQTERKRAEDRWQPEAPAYRFENHPDNGWAMVVEKAKGMPWVTKVHGKYIVTVANTPENHKKYVETGAGVAIGPHILRFDPLEENEADLIEKMNLNFGKKKK